MIALSPNGSTDVQRTYNGRSTNQEPRTKSKSKSKSKSPSAKKALLTVAVGLAPRPLSADGLSAKTCRSCGASLPIDAFHRSNASRDGLQAECKVCRRAYRNNSVESQRASSRRHYAKNPAKRMAATKLWRQRNAQASRFAKFRTSLRTAYGITVEKWAQMYDAQNRACAICLSRLEFDRSTTVDHCHKSGKVRGLLCQQCNRGIGMLRDDVAVLGRAIEYIKNGGAS